MSKSDSSRSNTNDLVQKTVKEISKVLYRLQQDGGVHACALLSQDGLPIAFTSTIKVDRDVIAAMTSASFTIALRTIQEYSLGSFGDIILRASQGQILTINVDGSLLSCYAPGTAKVGLLLLYMRRAGAEIKKILDNFERQSEES